jgi:hypothetical protein
MRLAPIDAIAPATLDFSASSDVKEMALGTQLRAAGTDYDTTANVANWGVASVVYVSSVGAAAILPGTLVVLDKNFRITATAASEANTGRPVYVALTNFAIGSTTEQYGWILRQGIAPVRYSVAATAGNVYGGTAGVATPTAAAGVQILNARCLIAAASTFTRAVLTQTGSSKVRLSSVAGIYVGQAISGSGIPASSVVSSIDVGGTFVVIGSAVGTPVNATATAQVTATFTNTGYGICQLDNPTFQSQIT